MHDHAGFRWTIRGRDGGELGEDKIELEQLDADGSEWSAEGSGGFALGAMDEVVELAAGDGVDRDWLAAVSAALRRQIAFGHRSPMLLVIRADGTWYHATASRNRDSIRRHGLDWNRMTPPGIAGSTAAETDGIFLCRHFESAVWFAGMCREPPVDIWTVSLDGVWLESAPSGSGGSDWMICPQPIPPDKLALNHRDLSGGGR